MNQFEKQFDKLVLLSVLFALLGLLFYVNFSAAGNKDLISVLVQMANTALGALIALTTSSVLRQYNSKVEGDSNVSVTAPPQKEEGK